MQEVSVIETILLNFASVLILVVVGLALVAIGIFGSA